MFDYDQRGILDATHLRFFTRRSIRKLIERQGFTVRRIEPVGLPLDALGVEEPRRSGSGWSTTPCCRPWPTMFGYQFIIEATPIPNDRPPGRSGVDAAHHGRRVTEELFDVLFVAVGRLA